MIQVDMSRRASPSPSRGSVKSEGRGCRQTRVIQVNRDASTMVDSAHCDDAPPWDPCATAPRHAAHFRSRTFSDGFIRNTSLELLLGVECDACTALAAQRTHYPDKHISDYDCDLVCNCNERQNNYLNCRDPIDKRGYTLNNIYDLEKMKRSSSRGHIGIGSHRSLDRKYMKSKQGPSSFITKQLISYDPTSNFLQKIKRKLSNFKKLGSETISKKHQNNVQLSEMTSASSSLKKLSILSLVDKSTKRIDSQSCVFNSPSQFRMQDVQQNRSSTYANFSGNMDQQCLERVRDHEKTIPSGGRVNQKLVKMRSFDNNDQLRKNNSANLEKTKFFTLDNRSRCRNIRRQMSCNEFTNEQFRERVPESYPMDTHFSHGELAEDDTAFFDAEALSMDITQARCTCGDVKIPPIYHDSVRKKRSTPAPDVTERGNGVHGHPTCVACKPPPHWHPSTVSTTSHSSTTTGNSSRFSSWHRRWCCVAVLVLVAGSACVAGPLALRAPPGAPLLERLRLADQLLHDTPLVDGHNDLPWNIRKFLHNKIRDFRFDEDLRTISPWATSSWSHTDLPRLKQGRVAAQFWAAYVPCDAQHRDAVQLTFEQIDLIQRLTDKYHPQLTLCTTADEIISAHANHRVCSLVGVEGGHAIGGSLGVLRTLFQLGVRYLTLTSTCDTPWAESSTAKPEQASARAGLTPFGKVVIKEMNRLGMLVDLSHVSERTMRDALALSRAPVLFSHSSARALCNVTRNVPDDVLRLLAANKGLVMVNFYTTFLTCQDTATIQDAIAHINHIRDIAGVDSVGLGAGYDGINFTPQGLEDVSSYPVLFAELMAEGWSMEDLRKLAGLNLLRVLEAAGRVAKEFAAANIQPYEDSPPRVIDPHNCSSEDL